MITIQKILWINDLNFELLPVQSPLLRQSLLISFPPLSNMLKSSGSSYLISGANWKILLIGSLYCDCYKEHSFHMRTSHTFCLSVWLRTLKQVYWVNASVRYVRKSDDSWFCNSHCISHSCCVLHRYGSQDIHRWKFSFYSTISVMVFSFNFK